MGQAFFLQRGSGPPTAPHPSPVPFLPVVGHIRFHVEHAKIKPWTWIVATLAENFAGFPRRGSRRWCCNSGAATGRGAGLCEEGGTSLDLWAHHSPNSSECSPAGTPGNATWPQPRQCPLELYMLITVLRALQTLFHWIVKTFWQSRHYSLV